MATLKEIAALAGVSRGTVDRVLNNRGSVNPDTARKINEIINKFQLPTTTEFSAQELFCAAKSDKKRSGSHVNLIVPVVIGNCVIHSIPVDEMLSFIKAGL